MSYINPDYPTNVGSFAQHTYQGQQAYGANGTFYYGGAGYGTTNDVRRPDGFNQPQQPNYGTFTNPYGNYYGQPAQPAPQAQIPTGVGQMLSVQEQGVQPFSSYPPNNGTQPGFNQFMYDARRADANAAQAVGNNPWAQNQTTMSQPAPMPITQPVPQYPTGGGYYTPGYGDASAMYQYNGFAQNPFEKKPGVNMWDNMYVQQQPYVQPAPNPMQWTTPQQQAPQQNIYNFPQATPGYNPPPQPGSGATWKQMAEHSWEPNKY